MDKKNNSENKIIAFIGKGGTGKTILSALTGKIAIEKGKKVLFIDADPAMGLATAIGAKGYKTIGKAREEIILKAKADKVDSNDDLEAVIDYLLLQSLYETQDYCMFVMGYTNTIGCYCPVNNLLRDTIKAVSDRFDIVIIDAEAGIEQINRQVTESVHYPILVTDNSMRGVKTTILAYETIKSSKLMNLVKAGVIFNRVEKADEMLVEMALEAGLFNYGTIPSDEEITSYDMKGISPLILDSLSKGYMELKSILEQMEIIS